MVRSTRSPVRWPTTGPGQGFWTKEFILIELIAPELDWFQVCLAHHPLPHTSTHSAERTALAAGRNLLAKKGDRKRRLGLPVRKCKTIPASRFYL